MATVGRAILPEPVIKASELYRFYHAGDDETFALRGISLTVIAGEILAIVGPSGSGKSTLLACLAGLDEPDGGYVVIGGSRITRKSETIRAEMRARWIGMLLQSGNLLANLTVGQNIKAVQHLVSRDHKDAHELLSAVGLEDRASAWPSSLSGGEMARAGLAIAIANDPPILLADEPTGEVDAENEAIILELLRGRVAAGNTVIVVTHSERVSNAADRIVHLADGRIINE